MLTRRMYEDEKSQWPDIIVISSPIVGGNLPIFLYHLFITYESLEETLFSLLFYLNSI